MIANHIHDALAQVRKLQEFILEEAQLSPTQQEMDSFISGVQDIVERAERIEARLARLKQQVHGRSGDTP